MLTWLAQVGTWTRERLANATPWSNVYGLARTLVAGAMAMTLACTRSENLFRPSAISLTAPMCTGATRGGLFCLVDVHHLEIARWLAVAALVVVASGWRPRFTGLLHWYVAFSYLGSASVVEGGDQVCAIVSLMLLPVTLTDPRTWHWQAPPAAEGMGEIRKLVATFALLVLRVQVAAIYFDASVGKIGAPGWGDGTAVYYWFTHPTFGVVEPLVPFVRTVLSHAPVVCAVTWGVMLVEFALFLGLLLPKAVWPALLALGLALHGGIIVIHGLASFGVVMMGALVLFLRPHEKPFRFPHRATERAARTQREGALVLATGS